MIHSQRPRQHADADFLGAKQRRWCEPHVASLNALAVRIERGVGSSVPFVDPDSGGTTARTLILLESPSRAAAHRSRMVSVDNDDSTAANLWRAHQDSGLSRRSSVIWNAVPWYLGTSDRLAAVRATDIAAGSAWLLEFMDLLPDLAVVITLGGTAGRALARPELQPAVGSRRVVSAPHPSQRVYNRPGVRAQEQVHAAFAQAAR